MELPPLSIEKDDLVIAADGGLYHTQKWGITPQVILGDFDSLGYVPERAKVSPVEKDDTDAMLALRRGLELGHRRFVIYGGLDGPRVDHTVANFQTLQFAADQGAAAYLVGLRQIATVVKNGAVSFPSAAAGTVSVFCMGEPARGVSIRGLKYELDQGTLTPGFPLGVSNSFVG
jgi:thiamine pyrophosphokinase